jgi:hypothetical protein
MGDDSSKINTPEHVGHEDRNVAYHMDWGFRKEAAIFDQHQMPIEPNIRPIGGILRKWMLREGGLEYLNEHDKKHPLAPTNSYTYNAYALVLAYSAIINDAAAFVKSDPANDPLDDEIKHFRLYSAYVLYPARILEALVKQMLFLTTFSESSYKRIAIGELLSVECSGCRASEDKRHKISLLGSIAHRYGFCGPYEQCLHSKMEIVKKRRDIEAAHAGVVKIVGRSPERTRQVFRGQISRIGEEFIHMLKHIEDMENHIIRDLRQLFLQERLRVKI